MWLQTGQSAHVNNQQKYQQLQESRFNHILVSSPLYCSHYKWLNGNMPCSSSLGINNFHKKKSFTQPKQLNCPLTLRSSWFHSPILESHWNGLCPALRVALSKCQWKGSMSARQSLTLVFPRAQHLAPFSFLFTLAFLVRLYFHMVPSTSVMLTLNSSSFSLLVALRSRS